MLRTDKRRGRTLSPGARSAKQTTPHGPLQRLLGLTAKSLSKFWAHTSLTLVHCGASEVVTV